MTLSLTTAPRLAEWPALRRSASAKREATAMRTGFVRRIGGGMPATRSRSLCLPLGLALVAIFAAPESRAQTAKYPDRPVKMLVGFAAGGGTDVIARIVAQKMSEGLGQTVLV